MAIGVLEKLAFNTSYFATLVQYGFMGGPVPAESPGGITMDMVASHPLGHFLTGPGCGMG